MRKHNITFTNNTVTWNRINTAFTAVFITLLVFVDVNHSIFGVLAVLGPRISEFCQLNNVKIAICFIKYRNLIVKDFNDEWFYLTTVHENKNWSETFERWGRSVMKTAVNSIKLIYILSL